ncbi:hypothetical protein MHYP_G00163860, partial [Metynnis hypsauchen]
NAIQAFGNGTDVGVWQPQPPIPPTAPHPNTPQRGRDRMSNALDDQTLSNDLDHSNDHLYSFCGSLQAQKLKANVTIDVLCMDPPLADPSSFNAIAGSSERLVFSAAIHVLLLASLSAIQLHKALLL